MPTQDNCDDLKVESCVDENGQTINGGDSYEVPTGRYVKHVVNVCGSGGSTGPSMKACDEGGLEVVGDCMQIKTETDSALVLDGGVLKIDSTKLKVTSDNVLPAGTDPGLLSTVPAFVGPDGEVWDNQSDYNKWLYEDQKRQDKELQDVLDGTNSPSGNCDRKMLHPNGGGTDNWLIIKSGNPDNRPSYETTGDPTIDINDGFATVIGSLSFNAGPRVDDWLVVNADDGGRFQGQVTEFTVFHSSTPGLEWQAWTHYTLINCEDTTTAGTYAEVCVQYNVPSSLVTRSEFEEDQQRQDEALEDYKKEVEADQKRQDQEIEDLKNAPAASGQMVFWGILPKDAPTGALWTDQDTLKMYVHTGGGTWAQVAQCTGDGETITETPWIRIDEMRVLRQYSGFTHGSDSHITKIMYADYHYNDHFAGKITDEWEWDENGDGNWVTYDPRTDSEADSRLDDSMYFYYLWSCEAGSGNPPMDVNHPHPCAKLRTRLTNTWDNGQSESSEWFEVWLAKEQNPAMNYPYQPPSTC